jgi:hypothetical protein
MPRMITTALLGLALVAGGTMSAQAAPPCKDAKGKFIKCAPKPVTPVKKAPCKDAHGKFIKCK